MAKNINVIIIYI